MTDGGTVIVGRTTFEDFGKPLPNRKNIVLTRDESFRPEDVLIASTPDDVYNLITEDDPAKVFVIGGGTVYMLFLEKCKYAYITKIEATPLTTVFLPNLDITPGWVMDQKGEAQEEAGYRFAFHRYLNTNII